VKFRAALIRNWPLKLTSLALAVVLWVVATAEEPIRRILPVELLVEPPAGRMLAGPPPIVRATVITSARGLLQMGGARPRARVSIPDTVTGSTATVELHPADVELPRGIDARVIDVQPQRVAVQLDPPADGRGTARAEEPESVRDIGRVDILRPASLAGLRLSQDTVHVVVRGLTRRVMALTPDSVVVRLPPTVTPAQGDVIPLQLILPRGLTGFARPETVAVRRGPGG